MADITKKSPIKNPLQIDHETGDIVVPGFGRVPLVGPTSGSEYKRLKGAEQEKRALNRHLHDMMTKAWKCQQCGKVWPGTKLRIVRDKDVPGDDK